MGWSYNEFNKPVMSKLSETSKENFKLTNSIDSSHSFGMTEKT